MQFSPEDTNSLPPHRERPVGFLLPASITGQLEISSKHIPCNCRCGYWALPDRVNHKCSHPDHPGCRIVFSAMCCPGNDGEFGGICNFCLSVQEAFTNNVVPISSDDVTRKCANQYCGNKVSNPSSDGVGIELCEECDGALQKSCTGDDLGTSDDDQSSSEDDEDDSASKNYIHLELFAFLTFIFHLTLANSSLLNCAHAPAIVLNDGNSDTIVTLPQTPAVQEDKDKTASNGLCSFIY